MQIFCDFDGTISVKDSTDHVLHALARKIEVESGHTCNDIEEAWERGEIGSGECMRRQIALIDGDQKILDAVLDEVEIDPGFAELVAFCEAQKIKLTVVSDGVDYFISRILLRHDFKNIDILSNKLTVNNTGFTLANFYAHSNCAVNAGVCKCKIVKDSGSPRAYIGDGRSDFCVSKNGNNDIVFAKGKLAKYCNDNDIAHTTYETLSDVVGVLRTYQTTTRKPASNREQV